MRKLAAFTSWPPPRVCRTLAHTRSAYSDAAHDEGHIDPPCSAIGIARRTFEMKTIPFMCEYDAAYTHFLSSYCCKLASLRHSIHYSHSLVTAPQSPFAVYPFHGFNKHFSLRLVVCIPSEKRTKRSRRANALQQRSEFVRRKRNLKLLGNYSNFMS